MTQHTHPHRDPWYLSTLAAFDVETTGVNVETDRVVTAAVLRLDAQGAVLHENTWLLDPGVEIPEPARRIHGISTEHARAEGVGAPEGITRITAVLAEVLDSGLPLVVMNAPYDLSLLDRECRRHGVPPLADREGELGPVLDPLILDKYVDRYRRGKRNLGALCEHYGVAQPHAHQAGADAAAAAAVTRRIAASSSELATASPTDLHRLQVKAAAQQAASLQSYLRRRNPDAVVDPSWPLIPGTAEEPRPVV